MLILYPQPNGNIAVVIPTSDVNHAIKDVPKDTPYKIVETIDIINEFFDAYEFDQDKGAVLNIEKAKDIKRNQFRQARKPLLEQLDLEFMRAVETSNAAKKKTIAAKKQELRDVTAIELPDNVDELVEFWPDILN
jgi:hypothetical protein